MEESRFTLKGLVQAECSVNFPSSEQSNSRSNFDVANLEFLDELKGGSSKIVDGSVKS